MGDEEEYEDDSHDSSEEEETDSDDDEEYDEEEDDSLDSNEDDEEERLDAGMQAYVQLNSSDTAGLMEGDEHKEWERLQKLKDRGNHRRGSTEFWKWNTPQLIAQENEEQTVDDKELNKMWLKLKNIPKSFKKDSTETRIVK